MSTAEILEQLKQVSPCQRLEIVETILHELRNIIERALIESDGTAILPAHLHLLRRGVTSSVSHSRHAKADMMSALPLNLADAEDILIQRALQETNGNIADAARLLGVHRTRIYRKLAQEETAAS